MPTKDGLSAKQRFIRDVRARTVCARCGGQPVDWHNPEHCAEPHRRLGRWRAAGTTIADIEAEIARCEPLCRSCHMREDGRADRWHKASPRNKRRPDAPCAECGNVRRLVGRGKCNTCYQREYYHRARKGRS